VAAMKVAVDKMDDQVVDHPVLWVASASELVVDHQVWMVKNQNDHKVVILELPGNIQLDNSKFCIWIFCISCGYYGRKQFPVRP
jgi:hypothetical protein